MPAGYPPPRTGQRLAAKREFFFWHVLYSHMAGLLLRVLVDNMTLVDQYYLGEPGFSCYLVCDGKKVLFDTGYSGIFLGNAAKMGIDLFDLDTLVLSHGHNDHTGGLPHLLNAYLGAAIGQRPVRRPELIAHPACFCPRPVPPAGDIGCPAGLAKIRSSLPVTATTRPVWLTDSLVFLGEIARSVDVIPDRDKKRTIITPEGPVPDQLLDDSALAYVSDAGLVILTGCAHAGLLNVVAQAREITGVEQVRDIIGGFHLKASDRATIDATVAGLRQIRPQALHPCHCTSLAAKIALSTIAPLDEVGVGFLLEY